jgi:hypothetical protein
MDYETLLIKALRYDYPEEIPVSVWTLPALWIKHPTEMLELAKQFPQFFGQVNDDYDFRKYIPPTYHAGSHTDEWGCVWSNIAEGMESIVVGHPVKTRADILTLQIPPNKDGRMPHGFMYLRLLDLRGFEEAMFDFADECPELRILIDKVTTYNCIQAEVIAKRPASIYNFGDDLGMQNGIAIGPEKWRKYLKPSYKKIYDIMRKAGKYVYMHTDGMVYEIIPDLFETGVQIVNPQFRANGLDNLVDVCKGRYPIHLDLDRQLFPLATSAQCRAHVYEAVEALYLPSGGLALFLELGPDVPLANVEALLKAVDECRFFGK